MTYPVELECGHRIVLQRDPFPYTPRPLNPHPDDVVVWCVPCEAEMCVTGMAEGAA